MTMIRFRSSVVVDQSFGRVDDDSDRPGSGSSGYKVLTCGAGATGCDPGYLCSSLIEEVT